MNVQLFPDFFAMGFLVLVLALVRRRYHKRSIRLWNAGLILIMVECAARILYGTPMSPLLHKISHMVALDAYFLAGACFLRSAAVDFRRMPKSALYLAVNVAPHIVLLTIYGLELRVHLLYRVIAIAGCVVGFASAATFRRGWRHYAAFVMIWTPLIVATSQDSFRVAIYISLFCLYLLTAICFLYSLPEGSRGKLAVVTGFVAWSLCFLTHPWIAISHPAWGPMANEIWNMQKFVITVGFMLVLFEKELKGNTYLALHDELTSLPNRRLFDDRLAHAVARAERDRTAIILFNLDLNGFKQVNDLHGHDMGDAVLQQVSRNLESVVRKTDTLARLGGDEFSMLAVDVKSAAEFARRWGRRVSDERLALQRDQRAGAESSKLAEHEVMHYAERIAKVLRTAVERPLELRQADGSQLTVHVSASVGIAVYPLDTMDTAELCRMADRRMYSDKSELSRPPRQSRETPIASLALQEAATSSEQA